MSQNTPRPNPERLHKPFQQTSDFKHECISDKGVFSYEGMLNLVPFLREDSDHVVFRRFKSLRLLHLMALQHRLKHCVEELQKYSAKPKGDETLFNVLDKLGPLFKNYGE